MEEVLKAVDELEKDQWFNIVVQPFADPIPLGKTFLLPTADNRERAKELLQHEYGAYGNGIAAFTVALQWRPDIIWYVGRGGPYPDQLVAEVAAANRKTKVTVNTTAILADSNDNRSRHILWELAHDSEGQCVDADGKPLAEPQVPVHVAAPPPKPVPAATKPSSLRVR